MALFLRDKHQVEKAVALVNTFSAPSGLKLNKSKCEILCLYNCEDGELCDIVIKQNIKYLGIEITKDEKERENNNFNPRIKKTKMILNLWNQRDVSIWGRALLTKAEVKLTNFL